MSQQFVKMTIIAESEPPGLLKRKSLRKKSNAIGFMTKYANYTLIKMHITYKM